MRSQKISQQKTTDLQAMVDEVDGILQSPKSKSYLTALYADDQFLLHRIEFEEQIVQDAKDQVERQHLLQDMDQTLQSLAQWREERKLKLKRAPETVPEQLPESEDVSSLLEKENQREIEIELNLQRIRELSAI